MDPNTHARLRRAFTTVAAPFSGDVTPDDLVAFLDTPAPATMARQSRVLRRELDRSLRGAGFATDRRLARDLLVDSSTEESGWTVADVVALLAFCADVLKENQPGGAALEMLKAAAESGDPRVQLAMSQFFGQAAGELAGSVEDADVAAHHPGYA